MKDWLTIGEFSKLSGLSHKALRLYEDKELLTPHTRNESQYRFYHENQLAHAKRILHFKQLGFTLEEIGTILRETNEASLKDLIQNRLAQSQSELIQTKTRILNLQAILTSLNNNNALTKEQRSQVMENIFEQSILNLKRRGVNTNESVSQSLKNEVSTFSEEQRNAISRLKEVIEYSKENKILLGPGRGSSAGSLVLYGLNYTPFNPLKYGLVPEIFAQSKNIWLEVEYSHHQEIGDMCDKITQDTGFEVVAFRSPVLDIFKQMQTSFGAVEFNEISDKDPMVLNTPLELGFEGLWDLDWDDRFHAFQAMSKQEQARYQVDVQFLTEYVKRNGIQNAEAFMNTSLLSCMYDLEDFKKYEKSSNQTGLHELDNTHGMILYQEDWVKVFSRVTGVSLDLANLVRKAVAKKELESEFYQKINLVKDENVKSLLISTAKLTFSKAHLVSSWWYYKRTAILKSLWPREYLDCINHWEGKHGIIWQEFGYKPEAGGFYLKAGSAN